MAPRRRAPVAGRPGGSPAWALLVLVLGLADAEPGPSGPCPDPLARALAELASWAEEHCDVVLGAGASGAAKSVSDVCLEWQAQTSPQSEVGASARAGGTVGLRRVGPSSEPTEGPPEDPPSAVARRLHDGTPIGDHHEWYVAADYAFIVPIFFAGCAIVLCVLFMEIFVLKTTLMSPGKALQRIQLLTDDLMKAQGDLRQGVHGAVHGNLKRVRLGVVGNLTKVDRKVRDLTSMRGIGQGIKKIRRKGVSPTHVLERAPSGPHGAVELGAAEPESPTSSGGAAELGLPPAVVEKRRWLKSDQLFGWQEDSSEKFWENLYKLSTEITSMPPKKPPACEIRWAQRDFVALEGKGRAAIAVHRVGVTAGAVTVKVCTREMSQVSNFVAKAGKDFVRREALVTFEDGAEAVYVELELLHTKASWQPTRIFNVELAEVVSGAAELGGPTVTSWDTYLDYGPTCRVHILQDDGFPANMPKELLEKDEGGFWLMWYYIKDRRAARGYKYWLTLRAMLFLPVHDIFVSSLVIKFIIDVAGTADKGSMGLVAGGMAVLFLSNLGMRYADYVQVVNRGRTGGTRMQHRQQLLAKLLMMDYREHCMVPGSNWFYASMGIVESMTADGYWQSYVLIQSVWALVVGILTLFTSAVFSSYYSNKGLNWFAYTPALSLVAIVPVSLHLINSRKGVVKKALELRMDREQAWVETLSWLSMSCYSIFSMGPRELARIENSFAMESAVFVKHHQKARDIVNDSTWITRWLGSIAYILIVMYAGFNLLRHSGSPEPRFTAGDFALFVKVCDRFHKYLGRVNQSIVLLQKAAVATRRCTDLLNLQENKLLLEQNLPIHKAIKFEVSGVPHEAIVTKQERIDGDLVQTLHFTGGPRQGIARAKLDLSDEKLEAGTSTLRLEVSEGSSSFGGEPMPYRIKDADPNCIEFQDVELELPMRPEQSATTGDDYTEFYGLGPLAPLSFTASGSLRLPLGKVVYVEGGDAKQRLSFLALAAEVVQPSRGMVRCPAAAWSVMLPLGPTRAPHLTVLEALCLGGQNEIIARNMVMALGMDPDHAHSRLTVGQVHMIQICRALLRNPEVLIVARPMDFVVPTFREKCGLMLRLWQSGGFESIVNWLANGPDSALDGHAQTRARTLLITGMRLPGDTANDVRLDLDRVLGAGGGDIAGALSEGSSDLT